MGLLPNLKKAAQDKAAEVKGRARAATIGKVENAVSAVSSVPGLGATCEHCHVTLPKIKMKKYGLGNNKWTCKNNKACRNRKGWAMEHRRWAKHVDYPAEFLGD